MKRSARSVENLQSVLKYSDVVRRWYVRIMPVPSSAIFRLVKNWNPEPVIMSDTKTRAKAQYAL